MQLPSCNNAVPSCKHAVRNVRIGSDVISVNREPRTGDARPTHNFGNCSIDRNAIGPSLSMTHVYGLIEIRWWRIDRRLGSTSTIAIAVSTRTADINDADVIADPNSSGKSAWKLITHSRIYMKNIERCAVTYTRRMLSRSSQNARKRYFGTRDLRQFTITISPVSRRLNSPPGTLYVSLLSIIVERRARPGKKINKLDARAIALNRS